MVRAMVVSTSVLTVLEVKIDFRTVHSALSLLPATTPVMLDSPVNHVR